MSAQSVVAMFVPCGCRGTLGRSHTIELNLRDSYLPIGNCSLYTSESVRGLYAMLVRSRTSILTRLTFHLEELLISHAIGGKLGGPCKLQAKTQLHNPSDHVGMWLLQSRLCTALMQKIYSKSLGLFKSENTHRTELVQDSIMCSTLSCSLSRAVHVLGLTPSSFTSVYL